jgi:DNA-binding transcriptional regulator WhiA
MKDWTEIEVGFIKENHEKLSIKEIAEYLGRTHSSVENKTHKLGLKADRKYSFNTDFFKNPLNEYSAYWLGFIYADGYLSHKELGIQLQKDDHEHLKKFNKCLNGNIPVTFLEKQPRYIKEKHTGTSYLCSIRVFSTEVTKDLNNLGATPKKSMIIDFPSLDNDYLTWCFIRGFFDGDGSIYYDKLRNEFRGKVTSGSPKFLKSFSEFLNKFGIRTYITDLDCGISGKESHRIFFSNIYENANIYLDRKYKKYQNHKYLLGLSKQ